MRQVVFLLAAFNPPRLAAALPEAGRRAAAAVAGAVTFTIVVVLAVASSPLLDAIDVSASTFRIAAGIVVAVGGAVGLVDRLPDAEPGDGRWRAGVIPLAFPMLLRPDLGLLAITLGADDGVTAVAVAAAMAVAATVALAFARPWRGPTAAGAARVLAAVLVVAGVALAVDGVQDL